MNNQDKIFIQGLEANLDKLAKDILRSSTLEKQQILGFSATYQSIVGEYEAWYKENEKNLTNLNKQNLEIIHSKLSDLKFLSSYTSLENIDSQAFIEEARQAISRRDMPKEEASEEQVTFDVGAKLCSLERSIQNYITKICGRESLSKEDISSIRNSFDKINHLYSEICSHINRVLSEEEMQVKENIEKSIENIGYVMNLGTGKSEEEMVREWNDVKKKLMGVKTKKEASKMEVDPVKLQQAINKFRKENPNVDVEFVPINAIKTVSPIPEEYDYRVYESEYGYSDFNKEDVLRGVHENAQAIQKKETDTTKEKKAIPSKIRKVSTEDFIKKIKKDKISGTITKNKSEIKGGLRDSYLFLKLKNMRRKAEAFVLLSRDHRYEQKMENIRVEENAKKSRYSFKKVTRNYNNVCLKVDKISDSQVAMADASFVEGMSFKLAQRTMRNQSLYLQNMRLQDINSNLQRSISERKNRLSEYKKESQEVPTEEASENASLKQYNLLCEEYNRLKKISYAVFKEDKLNRGMNEKDVLTLFNHVVWKRRQEEILSKLIEKYATEEVNKTELTTMIELYRFSPIEIEQVMKREKKKGYANSFAIITSTVMLGMFLAGMAMLLR